MHAAISGQIALEKVHMADSRQTQKMRFLSAELILIFTEITADRFLLN
jgi:hypothetical protein